MKVWVQIFKWLLIIGALVLAGAGVYAWQNPVPATTIVVVTPTSATPSATPTPSPTLRSITSTRPPTWTLTPTSEPSSTPTKTPTHTPTPTVTPTPAPIALVAPPVPISTTYVVTSTLPQPTVMPMVSQPKGTINILLLGSDRRPGEKIARTDVIMIVSIFPDVPSVSMISVPRDYYAWIPNWGLDKINTAYLRAGPTKYPGGGPALVKATIEYNFGIPIHYYALVDFSSYRQIVDAVGGVDLIIECPVHDTYPDEESTTGLTDIDLEPGAHHLDGKFALWYVRSRWNTSDFDRHRRQQQVLRAILVQALNQNMILRVNELWGVYQDAVETDMGLSELLYLAPIASRLDMRDIKSRFIRGETLLYSMTAPNGGAVLVPKYDALAGFVQEAAQPPVASRATQRAFRVEVWNGTGNTGWGEVAAYRLGLEGFEVVAIQDTDLTDTTSIVDFTTTSKGSPLSRLLTLYKLSQKDVTVAIDPVDAPTTDFRIILGRNYDPCVGTVTARWRNAAPVVTPTPTPDPNAPTPDPNAPTPDPNAPPATEPPPPPATEPPPPAPTEPPPPTEPAP
ncbi:MAG: LCP family protein [Anaerolineae bacterium]|nr:LCP family protein [Anaerolineae bacterium]